MLKNVSEEIMVSEDILKLPRNDIFCYIGILEEPGDVEWYYNRYFDAEKRRRDLVKKNAVSVDKTRQWSFVDDLHNHNC